MADENLKQAVIKDLAALIAQARLEGKWLVCSVVRNLWLSPDELEEAQAQGEYLLPALRWTLIDPKIRLAQLKAEVEWGNNVLDKFDERMKKYGINPDPMPLIPNVFDKFDERMKKNAMHGTTNNI